MEKGCLESDDSADCLEKDSENWGLVWIDPMMQEYDQKILGQTIQALGVIDQRSTGTPETNWVFSLKFCFHGG